MDWYSKYSSFQTSLIRGWGIRADQTFVHVVHLGGIKKENEKPGKKWGLPYISEFLLYWYSTV